MRYPEKILRPLNILIHCRSGFAEKVKASIIKAEAFTFSVKNNSVFKWPIIT